MVPITLYREFRAHNDRRGLATLAVQVVLLLVKLAYEHKTGRCLLVPNEGWVPLAGAHVGGFFVGVGVSLATTGPRSAPRRPGDAGGGDAGLQREGGAELPAQIGQVRPIWPGTGGRRHGPRPTPASRAPASSGRSSARETALSR